MQERKAELFYAPAGVISFLHGRAVLYIADLPCACAVNNAFFSGAFQTVFCKAAETFERFFHVVAVIIGGSLMGVWGMLLFIPSASVMYTLASESVKKRIEKEQIPTDKGFDSSPEKEVNRQDNVKENLSPQPAPSRHTEN